MNTRGYGGRTIKKRNRIITNDRVNDRLYLEMTGTVEAVVTLDPDSVNFRGRPGDEFEQVVRITPSDKYPFTILEISSKSDLFITAELTPPEEGEHTWQVLIKNIMNTSGRYFDIVTIRTDSETIPEIKIRVYAILADE